MENESKDSPSQKWGGEMSEVVEQLGKRVEAMDGKVNIIDDRVNSIDGRQSILSKEFELFGGWFKESLTSLKESTEEMKEGNNLLRESLAIQKIETEFKLKELEMKQEAKLKEFKDEQTICEQAKEIKKLSNSDKFKVWWADSTNLPSKLVLMFGGVLALALAGHFKVLDQVLQLLTK